MRILLLIILFPFTLSAQPKLNYPLGKIKMGKTSMRKALKLFPFEFEIDTIVTGYANFGSHCEIFRKISYSNKEHGITLRRNLDDNKVIAIFISKNYPNAITDSIQIGKSTRKEIIDYYNYSRDTSSNSSRKTEIEFKNNSRVWFRFKENKLYALRIRTSY